MDKIERIQKRHERAVVYTATACDYVLQELMRCAMRVRHAAQSRVLETTKRLQDLETDCDVSALQLRCMSQLVCFDKTVPNGLMYEPRQCRTLLVLKCRVAKALDLTFAFETLCPRTSSVQAPCIHPSARGPMRIDVQARDQTGQLAEWLTAKDIKIQTTTREDSKALQKCARITNEAGTFHVDMTVPIRMRVDPLWLCVRVKGVVLRNWVVRRKFKFVKLCRIQLRHAMSGVFSIAQDGTWMVYTSHERKQNIYASVLEPITHMLRDTTQVVSTRTAPTCLLITPAHTILACDGSKAVYELSRSGANLRDVCVIASIEGANQLALHGDTLAVGCETARSEHDVRLFRYSTGACIGSFSPEILSLISALAFIDDGRQLVVSFENAGVYVTTLFGQRVDTVVRADRYGDIDTRAVVTDDGVIVVLDKISSTLSRFTKPGAPRAQHYYGNSYVPNGISWANGCLFVNTRCHIVGQQSDFIYVYD